MSDATKGWRWEETAKNNGAEIVRLIDPDGYAQMEAEVQRDWRGRAIGATIEADSRTKERIAACLNACEGIPTDKLVAGEAVTKSLAVHMMFNTLIMGVVWDAGDTQENVDGKFLEAYNGLTPEEVAVTKAKVADMFDVFREMATENASSETPAPMTRADEFNDPSR